MAVLRNWPKAATVFLRQTACGSCWLKKASLAELQECSESTRLSARLAGVLALGFRLTVHPKRQAIAGRFSAQCKGVNAEGAICRWSRESYHARPAGRVYDGRCLGASHSRTSEEEKQFSHLLARRMDDADTQVAKQAAFYLRLLKDERVDAKSPPPLLGITTVVAANTPIANARTTGIMELPEEFRKFDWQKEAEQGDLKKGTGIIHGARLCGLSPDQTRC